MLKSKVCFRFKNEAEAIAMANKTESGLAGKNQKPKLVFEPDCMS